MGRVAALLPWRPGDPDRDAAGEWTTAQLARQHPDIEIVTSRDAAELRDGPWCKADHLAWLLDHTPSDVDIVVFTDVDVWVASRRLRDAIDAVGSSWAVPHRNVHRLNREATARLLAGDAPDGPLWPPLADHDEQPYRGHPGGGIVVAPPQLLREVPLDPRFTGWGQEDDSWAIALTTMAGQPWRGTADLIHLWHPPMDRLGRSMGTQSGWDLFQRYRRAGGRPGLIRALLDEIPAATRVAPMPTPTA